MNGPTIHFPTEEEKKAAVKHAIDRMVAVRKLRRDSALAGLDALARLMNVLRENHHTGQPYKLRRLLYSLWNGKPVDLTETLGLDWELKSAFCLVVCGFGYEDEKTKFFYLAIEQAFRDAGLREWFLEEGDKAVES